MNLAISLDIVRIREFDSRHSTFLLVSVAKIVRPRVSKIQPSVDDNAVKIRRREYKQKKQERDQTYVTGV